MASLNRSIRQHIVPFMQQSRPYLGTGASFDSRARRHASRNRPRPLVMAAHLKPIAQKQST